MNDAAVHCVIGSGPAGVACSSALLAKGQRVHMVDVGATIEPERATAAEALRSQAPARWTAQALAPVKEGMDPTGSGVVLKRSFGSDFLYRGAEQLLGIDSARTGLKPTLGFGGFSNVWGAAILPYHATDVRDWPIRLEELAPHYAAALKITGLSARKDALEEEFPLYTEDFGRLPFATQSQRLWSQLTKHQRHLRDAGILFGASRLAVKARRSPDDAGCVQCGLCMYGCPWGYIYNSASTVRQLQKNPNFTYESGVIVERVEESDATVNISGFRSATREPWKLRAQRVFVGAGVLPTAKIVLTSRDAYQTPRWILDSQYFLFPLLQAARSPEVEKEELQTLSQIFVEIQDPKVSPSNVHLQLYAYNDLLPRAVAHGLGPLAVPALVRRVVERMLIVQGYLHSDHSSRLRVELTKDNGAAKLCAAVEKNADTPMMVRRVVRKLLRHATALRALPVEPLLKIADPGRGFHSGGTFPMRAKPADLETDIFGRLPGWDRVHLVDSSVFPSVPATTITLSTMANAHRIATAVAD
jgi:choline dehydrogenase-like flavoprotein